MVCTWMRNSGRFFHISLYREVLSYHKMWLMFDTVSYASLSLGDDDSDDGFDDCNTSYKVDLEPTCLFFIFLIAFFTSLFLNV